MIDTTPFYSSDKAFADDGNGEIYTFQYDALEFIFPLQTARARTPTATYS